MSEKTEPKTRWNPWPWVPVGILSVVVVANIVLIHLAHTIEDGLLYDDWYERGLRHDEQPAVEGAPGAAAADPPADGHAPR